MIQCKVCGSMTNPPPDEAPADWHGYCPGCAFAAMKEGRISGPPAEFLLKALVASVAVDLLLDEEAITITMEGTGIQRFRDMENYRKAGTN